MPRAHTAATASVAPSAIGPPGVFQRESSAGGTSSGAGCLLQQPCDKLWMMQVNTDVQIVLEALGLADSKDAKKEEAALKDVSEVLKPHMGATWVTGNPNNKT